MTALIQESTLNIIAEATRIEGKLVLADITRIHGIVNGEIHAENGSILILAGTSVVEGNVLGNSVIIDGYVRGDVEATTRVVISRTGRVIGNVKTPSLQLEFGAHFEGRCIMDGISSPAPGSPAMSRLQNVEV